MVVVEIVSFHYPFIRLTSKRIALLQTYSISLSVAPALGAARSTNMLLLDYRFCRFCRIIEASGREWFSMKKFSHNAELMNATE